MGQVIGLRLDAIYRVMESLDVPKDLHTDTIDKVNLIHGIIFPIKKEGDSGDDPNTTAR